MDATLRKQLRHAIERTGTAATRDQGKASIADHASDLVSTRISLRSMLFYDAKEVTRKRKTSYSISTHRLRYPLRDEFIG